MVLEAPIVHLGSCGTAPSHGALSIALNTDFCTLGSVGAPGGQPSVATRSHTTAKAPADRCDGLVDSR